VSSGWKMSDPLITHSQRRIEDDKGDGGWEKRASEGSLTQKEVRDGRTREREGGQDAKFAFADNHLMLSGFQFTVTTSHLVFFNRNV